MPSFSEKNILRIFFWSLILKGINGTIEILAGILFLFTGIVTETLTFLVQRELLEDPGDFVANTIQHVLPYLYSHTQLFTAFYLLSHGIIKLFLVVSLLRKKIWAYPATIAVLILFVVYQLYRLTFGFSIFLILLTIFDIFLIALTWHEYKLVRKHITA